MDEDLGETRVVRPEEKVRKMLFHLLMEEKPISNEERDYLL